LGGSPVSGPGRAGPRSHSKLSAELGRLFDWPSRRSRRSGSWPWSAGAWATVPAARAV